ncbi:glycosyltransferase family 2 protein [bacterium]|nr:glycosyltransferase family 2 protein [bacterium]
MKKIENNKKSNFLKKLFIKLCRLLGFEIIDQSNFSSPTLGKGLDETLSIQGKKSITIPLGQIDIKKRVKSLKILLRTCTSELIMDQNKRRIFDKEKNQYTFKTLITIIKSINYASKNFKNISFELIVTDTNSNEDDIKKIKEILSKSNINHKFISISLEDFKDKITPGYSKAKFSNMANFYNSLLIAKNEKADLIYFVEDDYLHTQGAITEMIYSYEKFYSVFSSEVILLPADYPYLYSKDDNTKIYLGEKVHWRLVSESLVTFMTSKDLVDKYFNDLERMGIEWVDPWEKPLHKIYETNHCLSPIPSLAVHCANINSVFGISPFIDLKNLWEDTKL